MAQVGYAVPGTDELPLGSSGRLDYRQLRRGTEPGSTANRFLLICEQLETSIGRLAHVEVENGKWLERLAHVEVENGKWLERLAHVEVENGKLLSDVASIKRTSERQLIVLEEMLGIAKKRHCASGPEAVSLPVVEDNDKETKEQNQGGTAASSPSAAAPSERSRRAPSQGGTAASSTTVVADDDEVAETLINGAE